MLGPLFMLPFAISSASMMRAGTFGFVAVQKLCSVRAV
jgi:hypothetical protein